MVVWLRTQSVKLFLLDAFQVLLLPLQPFSQRCFEPWKRYCFHGPSFLALNSGTTARPSLFVSFSTNFECGMPWDIAHHWSSGLLLFFGSVGPSSVTECGGRYWTKHATPFIIHVQITIPLLSMPNLNWLQLIQRDLREISAPCSSRLHKRR